MARAGTRLARRALPLLFLPPAAVSAQPAVLELIGGDGTVRQLDLAALDRLPAVTVDIAWRGRDRQEDGSFSGPLLWKFLEDADLLGEARGRVRRVVTVTGRDSYAVVLALAGIAPDFEGKQVIVATRAAGRPIAAHPLRLVVPGDRRAGRAVRDVVGIRVD